MTAEEKFIFDLEVYIVIKNVLSPAEVTVLNTLAAPQSASGDISTRQPSRTLARRRQPFTSSTRHYLCLADALQLVAHRPQLANCGGQPDHDPELSRRHGRREVCHDPCQH